MVTKNGDPNWRPRPNRCLPLKETEQDYVVVDRTVATHSAFAGQKVSASTAQQWSHKLLEDPKNRLALAALNFNSADQVLQSRSALINLPHTFNVTLGQEGKPVTNQQRSGRCWLFASTNMFRLPLMRKYHLDEFELSQSYPFFWDKLEKANYFLENIVATAGQDIGDRVVVELMKSPVGDGGQWDMISNLVHKYGLVPGDIYPDAFSSGNSGVMDRLLTTRLRADALKLRKMAEDASTTAAKMSETKEAILRDIHSILVLNLGPPPSPTEPFTWSYYDADKKFHSITLTPRQLVAELDSPALPQSLHPTDGPPMPGRNGGNIQVDELFSLVHDPRHDFYTLLTVSRLGNVVEGRGITYVNVDLPVLKRAAVAMLRAGSPVFFGCDVGKYLEGSNGVLDPHMYEYDTGFGITVGSATALNKAERLATGESGMTHAMLITGVHVEEAEEGGDSTGGGEKTARWKVENSWGKDSGYKGYLVMADSWFDEFLFQIVVDPRFVDQKVRDVLKQDPLVLPLWDPMGALA